MSWQRCQPEQQQFVDEPLGYHLCLGSGLPQGLPSSPLFMEAFHYSLILFRDTGICVVRIMAMQPEVSFEGSYRQ